MEPEIVGKRIKELIKRRNISVKELSQKLEIDITRLEKKLNGEEEFYLKEMKKIKNVLDLDLKTFDEIFFKEDCKI